MLVRRAIATCPKSATGSRSLEFDAVLLSHAQAHLVAGVLDVSPRLLPKRPFRVAVGGHHVGDLAVVVLYFDAWNGVRVSSIVTVASIVVSARHGDELLLHIAFQRLVLSPYSL